MIQARYDTYVTMCTGIFKTVFQVCATTYGKNFDFPKMHQLVHLFDDVQNKGVTANFSTKPGEKIHGMLRYAYNHSSKKRATADAEVSKLQYMRLI
jgi:hypothetical protein